MSTLSTLPILDGISIPEPIASPRPNTPDSTDTSLISEQDIINGLGNTVTNPAGSVEITPGGQVVTTIPSGTSTYQASDAPLGSGILGQFEQWLQSEASNTVAVVIGLVLIAGAVFSFSQVKDTIVSTTKGVASLAA
jgi:hypothetical protein